MTEPTFNYILILITILGLYTINIKVDSSEVESKSEYSKPESDEPCGTEKPASFAVKRGKKRKCDKQEKGQFKMTSFMEFVKEKSKYMTVKLKHAFFFNDLRALHNKLNSQCVLQCIVVCAANFFK